MYSETLRILALDCLSRRECKDKGECIAHGGLPCVTGQCLHIAWPQRYIRVEAHEASRAVSVEVNRSKPQTECVAP